MLAKEIREKTNEELLQEIDTLKDELFNLRFSRQLDSWKTQLV